MCATGAPAAAVSAGALADAEALVAGGRFEQAAALLERALARETASKSARLVAMLADVDAQLGRQSAALQLADRAEPLARAENDFESLTRIESARGFVFGVQGR